MLSTVFRRILSNTTTRSFSSSSTSTTVTSKKVFLDSPAAASVSGSATDTKSLTELFKPTNLHTFVPIAALAATLIMLAFAPTAEEKHQKALKELGWIKE